MKFISVASILGLLVSFVAGDVVSSWALNQRDGQVYAISGNWLYELDNVEVVQNNVHRFSYEENWGDSHIATVNGKRSLFTTVSNDIITESQVARFDLPIGNHAILTPATVSPNVTGFVGHSAYNDKDSVILTLSNGKLLSLFNLQTLALLDSVEVYNGLRRSSTAVLYNQKIHRAVVFWYVISASTHLIQAQISEYDIANNKLVEAQTAFPENSFHFNNSQLVSPGFDVATNSYYIIDQLTPRLVKFNAGNLAQFSFISLGAANFQNTGNAIALYNFGAQLAYVISSNTARDGYRLQEIDLAAGTIRRSKKYTTNNRPAASGFLDIAEGNVYVGLYDYSNTTSTIAVVDLADFSQQLITLSQTQ